MKIVFSRKGFDSSAGGAPSPIVDGHPISLPIPAQRRSETCYGDLGLGELVEIVTKGRYNRASKCHLDPMFEAGRCAFGQTGAAQGHLQNKGVGVGDVFLFFGLFSNLDRSDRHHRIFGFLEIETLIKVGEAPRAADQPAGFSRRHPHTIGEWNPNNTIYVGRSGLAQTAASALRLSREGEPLRHWRVPAWLRSAGLTYHAKPERWPAPSTLLAAARGQEFVSDISSVPEATRWLDKLKGIILGKATDA